MYCFDSRIRYSEVDNGRRITLNAIVDYFQDCSSFQAEELGIGIDYMMQKQAAWVLSAWQVEISRYPEFGEKVTVSTWPYGMKSFFGYRNYAMESETGERLAWGNSTWVLLDLAHSRPLKVLPELAEAYTLSPQLPMEDVSRKIALPKDLEAREAFPVHKSHIDTNQHVNNGKYISMAQDYLPEGFAVHKMRAEYRKAAVYGDVIFPFVSKGGEEIFVSLADEEGKPYAAVEFRQ